MDWQLKKRDKQKKNKTKKIYLYDYKIMPDSFDFTQILFLLSFMPGGGVLPQNTYTGMCRPTGS